ncbi:MAG: hypothetical protein ABIH11_01345 [Candidatus Altiarchaeota archaeon]
MKNADKWYAIDALGESFDRTRKLLFEPFDIGFWAKLALIAFIAGMASNGNSQFNFDGSGGGFQNMPDPAIIITLAVMIIAFVIALMYLSSVASFAFIQSLSEGKVEVIRYFKDNKWLGLRLFVLQVAMISTIILLTILFITGLVFKGFGNMGGADVIAIIIMVLVIFAMIFAFMLFMLWVNDLVVPIMYARNCGVIEGFSQSISIARAEAMQFLVYILARVGLGFMVAIITLFISIPFMIIMFFFAISGVILQALSTPLALAFMIVVIMVTVMVSYIITLITLPLSVYVRCYNLFFLQHTRGGLKFFGSKGAGNAAATAEKLINNEDEIKVY